MKRQFAAVGFALCATFLGFSSLSRAEVPAKYGEWKDHPQEKFTNGEESFHLAMDKILQEFVDKNVNKDDLYRAATAGMLEALNPGDRSWNTMLTPQELKEIQADLSGQVSGIGVELKFDEATGSASILSLIPNSPAVKAGLKRDDQILSIDGLRNKGKSFREIVAAIRGKTGAPLTLKILRDEKILSLNIKRDVVAWTPVDLSKIDDSTELLTIGYFTGGTPKLVEEKFGAINAKAVKNLVIDLRNNSGGSFEKAVQTAELFVPQGKTIVSTKNREGKIQTFTSQKGLLRKDINVILLTNNRTSSGAELFAGALKEQLGAKTVGEKTFGKWNAQMIETLPNGFAIKFTTQDFQTPNGHSYQIVGLKPDVEVLLPKDVDAKELQAKYDMRKRLDVDTQLKAATELAKAQ
jgi:carboxyl-terminal processing protease